LKTSIIAVIRMQSFCGAFPVLPGKEQAGRDFAKACMDVRQKECADYLKRVGITKESWHLQKTLMGSFILVYYEAADVAKSFEILAKSKEPFEVWFKEQVLQVTGVDLNKPMEGPPPEQVFSMAT